MQATLDRSDEDAAQRVQDRSGEHTTIRCASCGAVDRSGTLVIEMELSSQEFFARYPSAECDDAPPSD